MLCAPTPYPLGLPANEPHNYQRPFTPRRPVQHPFVMGAVASLQFQPSITARRPVPGPCLMGAVASARHHDPPPRAGAVLDGSNSVPS